MTYFAKNIIEAAEKLATMVRDSGGRPVSLSIKRLRKSLETLENAFCVDEHPTPERFITYMNDAFSLTSTCAIYPCILVELGHMDGFPDLNSYMVFPIPAPEACTILTL